MLQDNQIKASLQEVISSQRLSLYIISWHKTNLHELKPVIWLTTSLYPKHCHGFSDVSHISQVHTCCSTLMQGINTWESATLSNWLLSRRLWWSVNSDNPSRYGRFIAALILFSPQYIQCPPIYMVMNNYFVAAMSTLYITRKLIWRRYFHNAFTYFSNLLLCWSIALATWLFHKRCLKT